jgi:hypothetical protein
MVREADVDVVEVVVAEVVEAEEAARPSIGGVATLAGVLDADEGLGVEGFDHDSKKSSSPPGLSPPASGVAEPVSTPSTCIPFGYL